MLEVTRQGGVARVTLNRPELRNAFDDSLIKKLHQAFDELSRDKTIRVMVLAGNGPAFCAGADLNWMKRMAGYSYDENLADAKALADMLAALDRKARLAPTLARQRGWPAQHVGRILVLPDDRTARRRIDAFRATFDRALPLRTVDVKRWILTPTASILATGDRASRSTISMS